MGATAAIRNTFQQSVPLNHTKMDVWFRLPLWIHGHLERRKSKKSWPVAVLSAVKRTKKNMHSWRSFVFYLSRSRKKSRALKISWLFGICGALKRQGCFPVPGGSTLRLSLKDAQLVMGWATLSAAGFKVNGLSCWGRGKVASVNTHQTFRAAPEHKRVTRPGQVWQSNDWRYFTHQLGTANRSFSRSRNPLSLKGQVLMGTVIRCQLNGRCLKLSFLIKVINSYDSLSLGNQISI